LDHISVVALLVICAATVFLWFRLRPVRTAVRIAWLILLSMALGLIMLNAAFVIARMAVALRGHWAGGT